MSLSGVSGVFGIENGVTDAAPSLRLYFSCLRKADLPPSLGVERTVPSLGLSGGMSGASSSGGGDLQLATREGDVTTDGRGSVCVDTCSKS